MGNCFSKGATEIRVKNLLLFELARVLVLSLGRKLGAEKSFTVARQKEIVAGEFYGAKC
jgi:hypothetical protein